MLDRRRYQRDLKVAAIQTGILLVVIGLSLIKSGRSGYYLMDFVDGSFTDKLFLLRNKLKPNQPISPDVTLVGIDDHTNKKLGNYGKGVWVPRKPFFDQLEYFQKYYKPRVMAYDIIFAESMGENQSDDPRELWEEKNVYKDISEVVQDHSKGIVSKDHVVPLTNMSLLATWVGEMILAERFGELDKSGTKAVLAYFFPDDEEAQKATWNQEDILGDDPEDLSEDSGLRIPDLRDVSVPCSLVQNLPDDYPFLTHPAVLPGGNFPEYGYLASINVPRDRDGIIRRYPLLIGMKYSFKDPESGEMVERKMFVPTLAFLSCLIYWGIDLKKLETHDDFIKDGKPIIEVDLGNQILIRKRDGFDLSIPIDDRARLMLDYVGTIQQYNNIPFASVDGYYKELVPKLRSKVVMVGITATGGYDTGPTPIADLTPLVHVHMTAASNMLTNTFITKLSKKQKILAMLILWIILTPCVFTSARVYTGLILCSVIGYIGVAYHGVHSHRWLFPITAPMLYIGISYFAALFIHYMTEERERKRIRGMFQTMVSDEVLQYMEHNPESFSLAGEAREATMFFSDVAGFTTISESLSPDNLVRLLNEYLTPMTEIIMDTKGYVDKYEGDAIMAVWGVPFPLENHAVLGCYAALDQQKMLGDIRDRLEQEFGAVISVRMGLNSGVVSAGNMGSTRKFQYTVMGDAVNQAARFEPANKDYNTEIMIGHSTYELAQDHIEARLLDKIVVKGKTVPIRIYELLARKGELSEDKAKVVELYEKALKIHWYRQFDKAKELLQQGLELVPDDGPCQALIRRIQHYERMPPPREWQGEYIRTSKD